MDQQLQPQQQHNPSNLLNPTEDGEMLNESVDTENVCLQETGNERDIEVIKNIPLKL